MRRLLDVGRHWQQKIEEPFLHLLLGDLLHLGFTLATHHVDRALDQIAHHRLDITAYVPDLSELGCLDFHEGRTSETGESARDLRFANPSRSYEDDVVGRDFFANRLRSALPPPAISERDRDRFLGVSLADDVAIQLVDNLLRGEPGQT